MSFAQKTNFKNISIKEGLPQSDVLDVAQDSIGYIWFATQGGGIAQFDGKKFNIYNQNNGLLSNYSNALSFYKNRLFIGTNKGLSIFYKNSFLNYKTPKINAITHLNNETYLATKEGIYAFKKDYVIPIKINLKIDLSSIISIEYNDSYYWIENEHDLWKTRTLINPKSIQKATEKEKNRFHLQQRKSIRLYQKSNTFKGINISKIYKDKQQNIWILTRGHGVYQSIPNNFEHFDNIGSQKLEQITSIYNKNNSVWFF